MSTIPVPAANAILLSAYTTAVANMLNQEDDYLTFTPLAGTNTPGAGTALWVTLGNLSVPTWATKARITVHCCALTGTVNNAVAGIAAQLGAGAAGPAKRWTVPTATSRIQASAAWLLTGFGTGTQSLVLNATFGTGTLAVDTVSTFDVTVDYIG